MLTPPQRLSRHHREGRSRAGLGRPARQGRRARRQPLARRAAQSRDRHRARHRAAAAVPRRADRRHERGRDPRHHAAGAPHRQEPHHPDRRARHAGGHGAARTASPCCTTARCWPRERRRRSSRTRGCWRSISRHEPRPRQPHREPLVAVEDLHTYYGKSHILHGVSLHVGRGEVVGLLGRNGVGKSTTLKTIMGLVQPEPGQGAARGPARHRPAGAQAGAARHRLRAGGPPHLPPAHGDGEPAHRPRPPRRDRRAQAGAARQGVRLFPGAGRAAQPGRRHAVGRRAADARHRPRHDARAQDHPARRADRRADAAHGLADPRRSSTRCTARASRSCWSSRTCRSRWRRASASTSWRRASSGTTPRRPSSRSTTPSSTSIWECEDGRSCILCGHSLRT